MSEIACRAVLCYNLTRNIVVSEDTANTLRLVTHLLRRQVTMDTLSPHASNGNSPEKRCTGPCGRILPATPEFFHRSKGMKDGLVSRCKHCASQYEKERWKTSEHREYMRDYRSHPNVKERRYELKRAFYNTPRGSEWSREYGKEYNKEYSKRPEALNANRTKCHNYRANKRAVLGTHTPEQIQELLKRQKHKCYYCLTKFAKVKGKYVYHVDHTFPLSRMTGSGVPANSIDYLVLACPTCNISKSDKFPWEFPEGGKLL